MKYVAGIYRISWENKNSSILQTSTVELKKGCKSNKQLLQELSFKLDNFDKVYRGECTKEHIKLIEQYYDSEHITKQIHDGVSVISASADDMESINVLYDAGYEISHFHEDKCYLKLPRSNAMLNRAI